VCRENFGDSNSPETPVERSTWYVVQGGKNVECGRLIGKKPRAKEAEKAVQNKRQGEQTAARGKSNAIFLKFDDR